MIEKYKEKYEMFYNIATSSIAKNKLSHAYLFECIEADALDVVFDFAKEILISNIKEAEVAKFEKFINSNAYPELITVKAEGSWIKKEQILYLQERLKTKSIYNNKQIYIIEEAEKLNKSSANTLLKFLEEPNDNIIALLLTKNRYQVIDTIISRCQIIRLHASNENKEDYNKEEISDCCSIIKIIEEKKGASIAFLYEYSDKLQNKETLNAILINMLNIYQEVLHVLINVQSTRYNNFIVEIEEIASYNNIELVTRKTESINYILDMLKWNVNIKLILDKLIVLMSGEDLDV